MTAGVRERKKRRAALGPAVGDRVPAESFLNSVLSVLIEGGVLDLEVGNEG